MINKMSSITFPDGSNYEITDDKARKDITEINNDIDNVQGAIDEINESVADVNTRVDGLYDVEKLNIGKTYTTSTTLANVWTYTATKKCLISGTIRFTHNNGYPNHVTLKHSGTYEYVAIMNCETPYDKTLPFCLVLEQGEQLIASAKYNNASNNAYVVYGYVQYLE